MRIGATQAPQREETPTMSESKDSDRDDLAGKSSAPAAEGAPKEAKSSGRVAFDARGNPIWEWQLETGVYSRDVSTQKLQKLNLGDLSIAETAIQKRPAGLAELAKAKTPPMPGGGSNPYDTSTRPDPSGNPYDNARALVNKIKEVEGLPSKPVAPVVRKPAPPPPPKESVLRRLDQWFKDKRRPKDDSEDYE